MSMVYGSTGHLDLAEISKVIAAGKAEKMALVFGIVFLVSGLAFKLGAVPFHMWVPDVYQGSPTAVTLILGGAPKLAAFAITLRLLVDGLLARRGYIDSASADAGIRRVSPDHSSQVLGIFGPQVNIEAWLRRWRGRPGVPAVGVA
ncbi:hypothetical protein G6F40_016566 [Rhizopus arrhizus]|nr:hypothetical protein G6F40_016566 [Rhizopus arrhizus]